MKKSKNIVVCVFVCVIPFNFSSNDLQNCSEEDNRENTFESLDFDGDDVTADDSLLSSSVPLRSSDLPPFSSSPPPLLSLLLLLSLSLLLLPREKCPLNLCVFF